MISKTSKLAITSAIGINASGIGLISSNILIKTKKLIPISENDTNLWETKLNKLKDKLKQNSKINELSDNIGGNNSIHLALDPNKVNFNEPLKARKALQSWCKNPQKSKEYFDELCKNEVERGWLF